MRILHLGNGYFVSDFRDMGHEVIHVGFGSSGDICFHTYPIAPSDIHARLPAGWNPDLIVLGDLSGFPMLVGLEFFQVPLVWYAIDSHIHLDWHMHYAAVFDLIFVAQRDVTRFYLRDGERQAVEWAPLFCMPQYDRVMGLSRDLPIAFVGSLNPQLNPARVALIDALRSRVPLHVHHGAYADWFNRSQIVLNQSVSNDVNFRTFQAMACGAMLLTERVGNGLEDLFRDGRHCALYTRGAVEEIVDLVRYYGRHPAEREAIAERGRQRVLARHTSRHRAERILSALQQYPISKMVTLRRHRLLEVESAVATVYDLVSRRLIHHAMTYEAGSDTRARQLRSADVYARLAEKVRREFKDLPARDPKAA
ncbi:MAG: glycosyltransferase [Nitrospiraceae bacterium]